MPLSREGPHEEELSGDTWLMAECPLCIMDSWPGRYAAPSTHGQACFGFDAHIPCPPHTHKKRMHQCGLKIVKAPCDPYLIWTFPLKLTSQSGRPSSNGHRGISHLMHTLRPGRVHLHLIGILKEGHTANQPLLVQRRVPNTTQVASVIKVHLPSLSLMSIDSLIMFGAAGAELGE